MKLIPMELNEHEQGEAVQKWLRQNGSSLLTGILLGLACILGWNWWQGKNAQAKDEAAAQYAAFTDAVTTGDEAKIKAFAAVVKEKYADTPYVDLVSLGEAQHLQSRRSPNGRTNLQSNPPEQPLQRGQNVGLIVHAQDGGRLQ